MGWLDALSGWLRRAGEATRPPPGAAVPGGTLGGEVTTGAAAPPTGSTGIITGSLLARLGVQGPAGWAIALDHACVRFGITNEARVSHFLATTLHETGNFTKLVENLNYSPEGLLRTWPNRYTPEDAQRWGRTASHPADQRAIAERSYGGRIGNRPEGSGDGFFFRGRGLIQVTGRANYEAAAKGLGMSVVELPAWMETPIGAATAAAWWWKANGCNDLAEAGDIVALRRRVNGGLLGLDAVRALHAEVLAAMRVEAGGGRG